MNPVGPISVKAPGFKPLSLSSATAKLCFFKTFLSPTLLFQNFAAANFSLCTAYAAVYPLVAAVAAGLGFIGLIAWHDLGWGLYKSEFSLP